MKFCIGKGRLKLGGGCCAEAEFPRLMVAALGFGPLVVKEGTEVKQHEGHGKR